MSESKIKKVTGYMFNGEIFKTEQDALNAEYELDYFNRLNNSMGELSLYGEYRFSDVDDLVSALGRYGLRIVKEEVEK